MILNPKDNILPIIKRELDYVMSFDPLADYEVELGADLAANIRSDEFEFRVNYAEPNVFKIWKCVA